MPDDNKVIPWNRVVPTEATVTSFAEFPKSPTELLATKTGSAKDWTPRDCLIDLLRSIDAGEYPGLSDLTITWSRDVDGDEAYGVSMAGPSLGRRIAALESGKLEHLNVKLGETE